MPGYRVGSLGAGRPWSWPRSLRREVRERHAAILFGRSRIIFEPYSYVGCLEPTAHRVTAIRDDPIAREISASVQPDATRSAIFCFGVMRNSVAKRRFASNRNCLS